MQFQTSEKIFYPKMQSVREANPLIFLIDKLTQLFVFKIVWKKCTRKRQLTEWLQITCQQFRLNWVHNHLFNIGKTRTEHALKSNDFKSFLRDSSMVATLSQRQTDSETPTSNYPLPIFHLHQRVHWDGFKKL